MTNKVIKLTIDKCFNTFNQSFKRVGYFSCINDNVKTENLPDEWMIKSEKQEGIAWAIPDPKTEENKNHLLKAYKHFFQCYLVRDCIESFAISLDNLFFNLLLNGKRVESNQTLLDCLSKEEKELLSKFQNTGLSSKNGKIQLLESQFNLALPKEHKQIITALKDIRNCLSHNNGIVRNIDGKKDGKEKRKFSWKTFHVFGVNDESGEKFNIGTVQNPIFYKKFQKYFIFLIF